MIRPSLRYLIPALIVIATGCAQRQIRGDREQESRMRDPLYLKDQACSIGRSITSAKGALFMKAKSREAEGQFPADVDARSPTQLLLEVQNPLGGTEATITIAEQRYELQVPKKKESGEKGQGSWAGIPLRWATELFLGRVPCPAPDAPIRSMNVTSEGKLEIETESTVQGAAERFIYSFAQESGEAWPNALRWERRGPFQVSVDFVFSDPESRTRAPLKWEARSARGEVKVRWRDRRISTH